MIAVDPNNAGAHLNLGLLLIANGLTDEGNAEWRQRSRLNPTLARASPGRRPRPRPQAGRRPRHPHRHRRRDADAVVPAVPAFGHGRPSRSRKRGSRLASACVLGSSALAHGAAFHTRWRNGPRPPPYRRPARAARAHSDHLQRDLALSRGADTGPQPERRRVPVPDDPARSQALANGENPLDHWSPELDLGAPRFLYYQSLPHLAVILLDRLLFGMVSLLTLFNVVRYLLLLGLPLTVYWSLRRMGFSRVASAFAGAASPLLSCHVAVRVRVRQLHLARLWHVHAALGDAPLVHRACSSLPSLQRRQGLRAHGGRLFAAGAFASALRGDDDRHGDRRLRCRTQPRKRAGADGALRRRQAC